MFPTTLQSLTELYICTRSLFWTKCNLNDWSVLHFSEIQWFRENFETTTIKLILLCTSHYYNWKFLFWNRKTPTLPTVKFQQREASHCWRHYSTSLHYSTHSSGTNPWHHVLCETLISILDTFFFFLWRCDPTRGMAPLILEVSISHTTTHHSR